MGTNGGGGRVGEARQMIGLGFVGIVGPLL